MMFVRVASLSMLLVPGKVRVENVVEVMEKAVHVKVEWLATERRVTFAAIILSAFFLVCRMREKLVRLSD